MKRLLSLLFSILTLSSCGTTIAVTQDNRTVNNFTFESNNVTWSQVYPMAAADSSAVRDWFSSSFTVTKDSPRSITAETPKNALPASEAGISSMSLILLFNHPCVVYFTSDFKADRYRVLVHRIIWYPQVAVTTYGVSQGVGAMDLNEIAVKNGGYKSTFYNTSSEQLNRLLTALLTAKVSSIKIDDNW